MVLWDGRKFTRGDRLALDTPALLRCLNEKGEANILRHAVPVIGGVQRPAVPVNLPSPKPTDRGDRCFPPQKDMPVLRVFRPQDSDSWIIPHEKLDDGSCIPPAGAASDGRVAGLEFQIAD